MDEEVLKTSLKQRIIIGAIAAILLISSLAVYVAIVMSGGITSSEATSLDAIAEEYSAKSDEIAAYLSPLYLDQLVSYKSEITGYNQDSANSAGVQTRDLVEGTGAEITEDFTNYYAYYIGYCPSEAIFDSSFDDVDNPSALRAPLDVASLSLIDGWTTGMLGAKVGGVREITIPSDLAYGDETIDACGGASMPLRFIVMTVDFSADENAAKLYAELDEIYDRYITAYYDEYASSLEGSTE